MKLLVYAGSTRQQSYNRRLAAVAARMARQLGAEVTHLELADFDVPHYNADLEARGTPADVMRLKQIAFEHPAWIICAPEYNASYPDLLKNTLDWISSPVKSDPVWDDALRATRGKVVGMLSASPGALGGLRSQSHLAPLLLTLALLAGAGALCAGPRHERVRCCRRAGRRGGSRTGQGRA